MNRILLAAALLTLFFAAPSRGEGALAVGVHDRGFHEGFAHGWHMRATTSEEAREKALFECRDQASRNGVPPEKCKIVEVFRNSCVAAAFDPQTRYATWGVGKDEEAARSLAMKRCKERGRACHISDLDCDR